MTERERERDSESESESERKFIWDKTPQRVVQGVARDSDVDP